jgi:hypothetical protein
MNPERWRQIEAVYQTALERRTAERASFLDQACADNEELRRGQAQAYEAGLGS